MDGISSLLSTSSMSPIIFILTQTFAYLRPSVRIYLCKGVTWRSQGFMWLTYRQNTSWINYFNLKNTLLSHYSYFSGLFYLLIPVWVTHTISHAYAYACPKLQKAVWYSHTYRHTRKKTHEHQTFHPLTHLKRHQDWRGCHIFQLFHEKNCPDLFRHFWQFLNSTHPKNGKKLTSVLPPRRRKNFGRFALWPIDVLRY